MRASLLKGILLVHPGNLRLYGGRCFARSGRNQPAADANDGTIGPKVRGVGAMPRERIIGEALIQGVTDEILRRDVW